MIVARGYNRVDELTLSESSYYYKWTKSLNVRQQLLKINKDIFDHDLKLKFIKKTEWKDDNVIFNLIENNEYDDLPF